MSILLDLNRRVDLILRNFSPNTSERIVSIALPFLSLNSKTAFWASAGMGAYESYHLLQKASQNKDTTSFFRFALVFSSTVLSIVSPIGQLIASNGVMLVVHISELFQNKSWVKKAQVIFKITDQMIHIGSIYYGSPRWIVLSLLSQACFELYQAQNFVRKEGKWPETFAYLILAGIRSYKIHSLLFPAQEKRIAPQAPVPPQNKSEKFKQNIQTIETPVQEKLSVSIPEKTLTKERPLTQEEWETTYYSLHSTTHVHDGKPNIALILEQQGFSKNIEGIDFKKTDSLNDLYWSNLYLKNCDFTKANLKRSIFENVHFDSCLFKNSCWIGSIVRNSIFNNCDFKFAYLIQARLETLRFTNCNFTRACFIESTLTQPTFIFSKLLETNFLHATVDKGQLIDSDLTDTLLLDTKEHFDILGFSEHRITRPIVAIGLNPNGIFTPKMGDALRDNGVIPLLYSQSPSYVDSKLLDAEIVAGIKELNDVASIPQELLRRAKKGSLIGKVQEKASEILKYCQGHVLPGGGNVEPAFYGDKNYLPDEDDDEMSLTMLEFALIERSHKNKIPTMGICRGAQMINVYFGGTLQNVESDEEGYHLMEFIDSAHGEWLRKLVQGKFVALSMHEQAVKKIGQGLHPILKRGDVIKFLVSEDEMFLASQIHPEGYLGLEEQFKGQQIISSPIITVPIMRNRVIETITIRLHSYFKQHRKRLYQEKKHLYNLLYDRIQFYDALVGLSLDEHLQNNKNIYRYFVQKTQAAFQASQKA
jgi:putative glutamine amidotransferase